MNKRVPVNGKTQKRLREFREAAGLTYDAAINMLLDYATSGEAERITGSKLRYEMESGQRDFPNVDLSKPAAEETDED